MITREELEHVAQLAKLSFDEQELDELTPRMQSLVDMVEHLVEVDTEAVESTYHGNQRMNVYREDQPVKNDHYQALLDNAPTSKDGYIQVPAILDDGEGA